jgi:hypothetical protein
MMMDNKVLRGIFVRMRKKGEVAGGCRELHSGEVRNFDSSPSKPVGANKLRKVRWVAFVACMDKNVHVSV